MAANVFEQFAKKKEHKVAPVVAAQKPLTPKKQVVNQPEYVYKDAKSTGNWDLDRIRSFLKTEINAEPNNDPDQVWYNVDIEENQKEGRFYALRSHLGRKKQKIIKKAYNVDELATYFFGPLTEGDFAPYGQYPEIWAKRQRIWNQYYTHPAWVTHKCGPEPAMHGNIFEELSTWPLVDSSENEKSIKNRFQPLKNKIMKAVAYQISKDIMYVDVYANGAEAVLEMMSSKYMTKDLKDQILKFNDEYKDQFDLEDEMNKIIESTAKKIGERVPVYRAGQWAICKEEGSTSEDWYSIDKDRVLKEVKSRVKETCEINKDNLKSLGFNTYKEYLNSEMNKVFCYRIY